MVIESPDAHMVTSILQARSKWKWLDVLSISGACLWSGILLAALSFGAQAGSVAFPDASTTGITETHCPDWAATSTPSGNITVTTDGAVIEYLNVTGRLRIMARDVTVRCVKIDQNFDLYGIHCDDRDGGCPGLLVDGVEIVNCDAACISPSSGGGRPIRLNRVHMHNTRGDLLKVNGNIVLENSYLHGYVAAPGAHNDAMQTGSGENIEIRGNRIDGPFQSQTSAFIVISDSAPVDNLIIEGNWLSGGAYTLYLREGDSFSAPTNVAVRGNVWQKDSWVYGPLSSDTSFDTCLEWQDNSFSDGLVFDAPDHARPAGSCAITSTTDGIFSDGFE